MLVFDDNKIELYNKLHTVHDIILYPYTYGNYMSNV